MFKLVLVIAGLVFPAAAMACDQKPEKLPSSMVCVESLCVSGRCQENSILFESLNSKNATAFYELESFNRDAEVTQSCENDKVQISANDGEQLDGISLVREDVKKLRLGRAGHIMGIREVGYWYADGDHTTSVSVVECMVVD